jgi:hypothetical protein
MIASKRGSQRHCSELFAAAQLAIPLLSEYMKHTTICGGKTLAPMQMRRFLKANFLARALRKQRVGAAKLPKGVCL